jgi:biuret amidohydrolase
VTTEVCVHTTLREANDRGYQCIVVEDACASYRDDFHEMAIQMVWAQGGLFGSVGTAATLAQAILQK